MKRLRKVKSCIRCENFDLTKGVISCILDQGIDFNSAKARPMDPDACRNARQREYDLNEGK